MNLASDTSQPLDQWSDHQPDGKPPQRTSKWRSTWHNFNLMGSAAGKVLKVVFYLVLISAFISPLSTTGQPKETVLYGQGEDLVAVIDLNGTIVDDGTQVAFGDVNQIQPRKLLQLLEYFTDRPDIKAVVLRVNSPGGSVTASEEIYQIIKRYRQQLDIPMIVYMSDTAASGGYYISLAADKIVANPATLTGSIGVIMQTVNFNQLADKIGVQGVVIKSGENKDLLNPFEEPKPEQITLVQNIIDETYYMFLDRVVTSRGLPRDQVEPVADGRVLSGQQALAYGLVDQTGTMYDAVELAKRLAGIKQAKVVTFGGQSFLDSLMGLASSHWTPQMQGLSKYWMFSGQTAYLFLP